MVRNFTEYKSSLYTISNKTDRYSCHDKGLESPMRSKISLLQVCADWRHCSYSRNRTSLLSRVRVDSTRELNFMVIPVQLQI